MDRNFKDAAGPACPSSAREAHALPTGFSDSDKPRVARGKGGAAASLPRRPDLISRLLISAVCAALYCLSAQTLPAQIALESGQWRDDYLSSWWWGGWWWYQDRWFTTYTFFAQPNETVIIRLGHAEGFGYFNPPFTIYNPGPDHNVSTNSVATWTSVSTNEYDLTVTNYGWYSFVASLPSPVATNVYTNYYTYYNISMLRVPNVPLSYQDLDVGTLPIGDSKLGTINVSSDLDAGFFAVTNSRSTMQIRMGQLAYAQVPSIQVFAPNGTRVTNDFPTDYRSEITSTLTNPGIYTVVCSDKFNAYGPYALTMVQIPGTLSGADTDIGLIISGEIKTGKINQPGDLDLASFSAVSGDVVTITMQEVDTDLNPVMEFYDPVGNPLRRTTDVFEVRAVIPDFPITSNGVYSIVCKDAYDRYNVSYTLEFNFMAGSPSIANLPAAPSSISASQETYSNRIDVTWNSGGGATGYDLWRTYSTNSAVLIYTNLLATTYADYDITAGLHYFYKVKSRNTYGTSTNFSPSAEGYSGVSSVSANRRVLLVGIDNYSPSYGLTPLTTCTNDVNGMRATFFLGDPSNRWSSTNMAAYTDLQATKLTIQNALHTLASASSAGDIVVYMHSSHGGTSGGSNAYIAAYDADYTDAELGGDLTLFNSETKVIVIIDACYSGGMFKFKDVPPPPWPFAENTMAHFRRIRTAKLKSRGLAVPKDLGQNIAFMTASDYNELSWTSSFYSRYIGYLIQGCNVQSVDTNSSGQYSFLEIHDYAAVKSMAETPTQNAQSFHPSLLENTVARAVGTNAVVTTRIKYNDFDGDNYSDLAIYNTASGAWRIGSVHRWLILAWDAVWGGSGYIPINGDYDGDRTTDLAVYNETQGKWAIASLSRLAVIISSVSFGGSSLTPVSGDYNGDGIYDGALCHDSEGFWYIVSSVGVPLVWGTTFTGTGFVPVSGDYDGDFISDLAMYSPSSAYWYIMSMTGTAITWGAFWGVANATPVSGDYDGDGYSDLAVYQESTGLWYIWSLKRQAIIANALYFGGPGFLPVQGDYDGDGVCDLALYQESTGNWYLRNVNGSLSATIPFGGPGYVPVLPAW